MPATQMASRCLYSVNNASRLLRLRTPLLRGAGQQRLRRTSSPWRVEPRLHRRARRVLAERRHRQRRALRVRTGVNIDGRGWRSSCCCALSRGNRRGARALVDFESKDARHVARRGWRGHELPIALHEEMAKGGAKVGAVDIGLPRRARVVNVLAATAKDLGRVHARQVALADWQCRLALAVHTWAAPKVAVLIFLEHGGHPTRCDNVARVDEPVQQLGG
mmetsp:Transcript_22055/g.56292  ORF Transcript_22055/g.56292 Transcript_22055/m.56292 type:complete len:220 (+) Transcript_22055:192-851(+)